MLTGDLRIDALPTIAKAAVIHGISPYGRFGWTMEFVSLYGASNTESKDWLVVGAPMYTENWQLGGQRELGALYAWSGEELSVWAAANGTTERSAVSATWSVVGTRPKARLGTAFSRFGNNGTLIVGSPYASSVGAGSMVGSVDLFSLQEPL